MQPNSRPSFSLVHTRSENSSVYDVFECDQGLSETLKKERARFKQERTDWLDSLIFERSVPSVSPFLRFFRWPLGLALN